MCFGRTSSYSTPSYANPTPASTFSQPHSGTVDAITPNGTKVRATYRDVDGVSHAAYVRVNGVTVSGEISHDGLNNIFRASGKNKGLVK